MTKAASRQDQSNKTAQQELAVSPRGITAISVKGYKALAEESRIEIKNLTILAGSNSSGKSSIIQPLLLMKQTLEATYDPGALLLDGPNLKFTSASQLFSNFPEAGDLNEFQAGVEVNGQHWIVNKFRKPSRKKSLELLEMSYKAVESDFHTSLKNGMSHAGIIKSVPPNVRDFFQEMIGNFSKKSPAILNSDSGDEDNAFQLTTLRNRCFFEIAMIREGAENPILLTGLPSSRPADRCEEDIQELIHVPGLRGNPERTYRTTAIGTFFPGTFENYVASVIRFWQSSKDERIKQLESWLSLLGLTCKIEAKRIDDTQVELKVGRLPRPSGRRKDMVNIADVGFGVSQVLPVLVALLAAQAGQLVYVEQPEIHLHPRAQVALAEILCDAAKRGVRVVAETHSEPLLLAIQSIVAEGEMPTELVKLHWFTRRNDGVTQISSADLDKAGAFGDWPEDFAEVSMNLENRYLSAAESKLWN